MHIQFYNTLTNQLDRFEPLEPPTVTMYNCGPTVYDYQHIGNFRSFMFADLLRRFLELVYGPGNVHQVMNLTDVGHMTEDDSPDGGGEDKMQVATQRFKQAKQSGTLPPEATNVADPDDPYQIAQYYIDAFVQDAKTLGLKIADEYPQHTPRATDYVPQMQDMIRRLLDKGHAYVAGDGAVYYSIESFPDYGRLSGNTIDQLRAGAGGRVLDEHQVHKKHPGDFLLWKPDPKHVMKWDSPWGVGYPYWHVECSVMAASLLGREVIDIHTGGEDNIFPHHECEIAQSRGATGQDLFARFWLHARYLMVDGEKMAKSKGNFITVRDLVADRVDPAVIRYELLKAPYRANANFQRKNIEGSASAVRRLRDFARTMRDQSQDSPSADNTPQDVTDHPATRAFTEALADDLNINAALGELFQWIAQPQDDPATAVAVIEQIDSVLNVLHLGNGNGSNSNSDADSQCRAIDQARADKDFDTADRIRQQLIDAGYDVMTTQGGTTARRKLA